MRELLLCRLFFANFMVRIGLEATIRPHGQCSFVVCGPRGDHRCHGPRGTLTGCCDLSVKWSFQMDKTEKPKKATRFANHAEVTDADAAALPSSTGRETSSPEDADVSIGDDNRRSEITG